LELIREGLPVPRGTLQAQFTHKPFDEVRRLGLQDSTEAKVRLADPKEIGMLVAEVIVPQGPAAPFLEEGDIVLSVNGRIVTKFVPLEDLMDER
jgi:S1-C subfamily serine protease